MRKLLLPLLAVPLLLAACGSSQQNAPKVGPTGATSNSRCTPPRNPPAMGEAIRHQLCLGGKLGLIRPRSAPGLCFDISNYQGPDPDLSGVRCLIIQSNDGTGFRNPYFGSQVLDARRHGIPWGTYTFLSGESGAAQASVALSVARGWGRSLGVWADAEQPGTYGQTCPFVNRAREGSTIVGVYSAPGIYEGGRCQGFLWPAEWSVSAPYPFAGYPSSAIKLWQFCGTCAVDRDQPRNGFLAPPLTPCQRHRTICRDLRARRHELRSIEAHMRRARCLVKHPRRACGGLYRHRTEVRRLIRRLERQLH